MNKEQKREAFLRALRPLDYEDGVTIGSYVGLLESQNKRYRESMENVLQTMATPYWHELKEEIVNTLLQAIEGESNE